MLIDVNCPLCQNPTKTKFDRRVVFDQEITNHICSRCGLVFLSPRMPEDELAKFYEQEYRQLYQGNSGPNPKDLSAQQGRAEALLDFTRLKDPEPNHCLKLFATSTSDARPGYYWKSFMKF